MNSSEGDSPMIGGDARALAGDASVIERSLTEPERFAVLFDRHASHIHRYLARRVERQAADLDSYYLLPAQQAALYGFLVRTPGIKVRSGVTDVAGRPGSVSVGRPGGQAMLIFDSRTYTYLGTSTRGIDGQRSGTALLNSAIVAAVGQVPGPSAIPAPTDGA